MVVNKTGIAKDFTGRTFRGAKAGETADRFEGIGLIVENCKDVVIQGGTFRGFRCPILGRKTMWFTRSSRRRRFIVKPSCQNGRCTSTKRFLLRFALSLTRHIKPTREARARRLTCV